MQPTKLDFIPRCDHAPILEDLNLDRFMGLTASVAFCILLMHAAAPELQHWFPVGGQVGETLTVTSVGKNNDWPPKFGYPIPRSGSRQRRPLTRGALKLERTFSWFRFGMIV